MLPFAWSSDIHLDHLRPTEFAAFTASVQNSAHPIWVITGDISNAKHLHEHVLKLALQTGKKIYFVLGNHDYYGSSISGVCASLSTWLKHSDDPVVAQLKYLPDCAPIEVAPKTYLVGVDGYADGRAGDLFRSNVWLMDYVHCATFKGCDRGKKPYKLKMLLNDLGTASAMALNVQLAAVFAGGPSVDTIFVATHVPPWPQANWYAGALSDNHYLPHFCNVALGDELKAWARNYPSTKFVVLAGHTHGAVNVEIAPNLRCLVAGAHYGKPILQDSSTLPTPDVIRADPALHLNWTLPK